MTADRSAIRWRIHLRSPPARVHEYLATADGRSRFWAQSADQNGSHIEFVFSNGQRLRSTIHEDNPPDRFALSYFGGSRVTFQLEPDGAGGTDLTLTEEGVASGERDDNLAGWVTVLLMLKAAVDFGVDLRNHDAGRAWDHGYVDI
jgi:uncharacterized protein YndB with AHSA1/START domain